MANIAFLDCSNLKVYPGYEGAAAAGGDPRQQQWVPYQVQCPNPNSEEKTSILDLQHQGGHHQLPGQGSPTERYPYYDNRYCPHTITLLAHNPFF